MEEKPRDQEEKPAAENPKLSKAGWTGVLTVLLSALGISGAGVSAYLYKLATDAVAEQKKDINKIQEETRADLEERIRSEAAKVVLNDALMKGLSRELEDRLETKLGALTIGRFTEIGAYIKVLINDRLHPQSTGENMMRIRDPRQLKPLAYALDNLLWEAAKMDATGQLQKIPRRKEAILMLLNAFADKARGMDEQARRWCELACRCDPGWAEANMLRAQFSLDVVQLRAGVPDFDKDQKEAKLALQEVFQHGTDNWESEEVELNAGRFYILDDKPEKAVEILDKGIARHRSVSAETATTSPTSRPSYARLADPTTDPRWYAYAAPAHFALAVKAVEPARKLSEQKLAIEYAWRAVELDPELLLAVNNYVWYLTHAPDEHETITLCLLSSDPQEERQRLEWILRRCGTDSFIQSGQFPPLLDTMTQAYGALAAAPGPSDEMIQTGMKYCKNLELAAEIFGTEKEIEKYRAICKSVRIQLSTPTTQPKD